MTGTPSEQRRTVSNSLKEQEQYWLSNYRRWQKSGLSLAGYARSQGLVVNTFYGWHGRLKKRGLVKPEPASTVFHRVTVKPTEPPEAPKLQHDSLSASVKPDVVEIPASKSTGLSLRFNLPNDIECEMGGMTLPIFN